MALTSPDLDMSSDARGTFTRHMRILEQCMTAWPMPDMQKQIDSVREAFSADTRKPFVLKPSFPYGSPQPPTYTSTPRSNASVPLGLSRQDSFDQASGHLGYSTHPISPPISAGPLDHKNDSSPNAQSLAMMAAGQAPPVMPAAMPMGDASSWNPARIFA